MNEKENCIVYSKNNNIAYSIREKSKSFGFDVIYIQNINEFFKFLINDKCHLLITTENVDFYKDIFEMYNKNICKNFNVINVKDGCVEYRFDKIYAECGLANLEYILPNIIALHNNIESFSCKMPEELIYKYTTEILLQYKFSPTMQGYNYIKQCVIIGVKRGDVKINLSQDIYKEVSKIANTSIASIEKTIRSTIKKTIQLHPNVYNEAGLFEDKITNASLINHFILQVKLKFIRNQIK